MNINLDWKDGINFRASNGRGHEIVLDGSPDFGGVEAGPRPMEMVLAALASCMAIDVVLMLNKARVQLASLRVSVEAQRSEEIPKVFRTIHLQFEIEGEGLSKALLDRCLPLAGDKYCSVSAMLRPNVSISYGHNVGD